MKKLLFIALALTSLAQAYITVEDAKSILDDELDTPILFAKEGERDKQADRLAQFAKVCIGVAAINFDTSYDGISHITLNLKYGWSSGNHVSYTRTNGGINCSQLADAMEKMAKNTEKYDSDMIGRLKKTTNEIRTAK